MSCGRGVAADQWQLLCGRFIHDGQQVVEYCRRVGGPVLHKLCGR